MTGTSIAFDGDVAARLANKLASLDLRKEDQVRIVARVAEGVYDDLHVEVVRPRRRLMPGPSVNVKHFIVRERRRRVLQSDS